MMTAKTSVRRVVTALTAVTVSLGITVGLAGSAEAAASNCPTGAACIWEDDNYVTNHVGANLVRFQRYIPDYDLWNYSGTTYNANDTSSSAYNNGNHDPVKFYPNPNRSGTSITFGIHSGSANLNNNGMNDRISSGYFKSY